MSKYKLMINAQEVDMSKLSRKNGDLSSIDSFTMLFRNEKDLVDYLVKKGIIYQAFNKIICYISYNYNGENKIPLLFQKHGVLVNPRSISTTYTKVSFEYAICKRDKEFLKKLYDFLRTKPYMRGHLAGLSNLINSDDEFFSYSFLLSTIFDELTHDDDFEYSYKKCRDLALILYDYSFKKTFTFNKEKENKSNEDEYEQLTFFKR